MNGLYILVDRVPVEIEDTIEWGRWLQAADRVVKQDKWGDVMVSTVFLGMDHQYGTGRPLLFETMVFGLDSDYQRRYSTWEEAERGHREVLRKVLKGEKDDGES